MFYEETEIGELVICPYCKNKYDDPRLIECGTSFCMSCIEFLAKDGTNGFPCPVCNDFHEPPKKGYLKNTTLAKLCNKKANKVYRGPLADALETQLDELKSNMDILAKENDLGAEKIKEYCNGLRNEVQLHLEQLTESLQKQSLELIKKIDEYEKEAVLKFNSSHNLWLDTFLSETRRFHEKWADYLKQFKVDDDELNLASHESKKLQKKLDKESGLFLSKVFNSNVLKFTKGTTVFGSLVNEGGKQSYKQVLKSTKSHNLRKKLHNTNKVSFKLLSNGNLCITFRKNNETLVRIAVFDRDLNQLAQMPCPMSDVYLGSQLVELNKAVVLCLFDNDDGEDVLSSSSIRKYAYDLKFIRELKVDFEINYASVHEEKLYLLATSSDQKSKLIHVYDENLQLLENIQLENTEGLPFYVPITVAKMMIADSYFVFLDGTNVLLMNRVDGAIKRTLSVNSSDFVLDLSSDRIIAYAGLMEKLVCFDFEGGSFEISIPMLKNFELVDYDYKRFVFFDENSFGLFF